MDEDKQAPRPVAERVSSDSAHSSVSDTSTLYDEEKSITCVVEKSTSTLSTTCSSSLEKLPHTRQDVSVDGSVQVSKWQITIQLLVAILPYMNSAGLTNIYGIFQTIYSTRSPPLSSVSNISWVGSLQGSLQCTMGIFVGPLIDAGYVRAVLAIGTLLAGGGMILTSWCTQYYQVMLVQGAMVGMGGGCMFFSSISVLPMWITPQYRTVMMGIVATSASTSGIIYPIVFHNIERIAGFAWATRAMGFIIIGLNAVSIMLIKYRELPKERNSLFDFSMFKEKSFNLLCLALTAGMAIFYVPIFYIQLYARTKHIGSSSLEALLIPIFMIGSCPGRIIPSIVAHHVGNLNVFMFVVVTCSLLSFYWIAVKSTASIITFALLFGFTTGSFVSLAPPTLISTAPHTKSLATRIGMTFAIAALGVLVGPPIAGALLTATGEYLSMQLFVALTAAASFGALLVVRYLKVGWTLVVKI